MSQAPVRTPYHMLSDLLDRPELLRPPVAVLPHLAYEGRLTLLASQEKAGKSTLLGQGAAALTLGLPFLGDDTVPGAVAWFALDEPLGDAVRRFSVFGARGHVAIYQTTPPLSEWPSILEEIRPRLVVLDTLTEFAAGFVEDFYSPTAWQPVLKVLRDQAQASGAAFVLLHHLVRGGGRYADSRQLGAGVDLIAEMTEPESDPGCRRIKIRGRTGHEQLTLTWDGRGYELTGRELPLPMRVYRAIEAHPGISSRQLRAAVIGKQAAIEAALRQLAGQGVLENRGSKAGSCWHTLQPVALDEIGREPPGTTGEPPREPPPGFSVSAYGPTREPPGNHPGEPRVVPGPIDRARGTAPRPPVLGAEMEIA